MDVPDHIRALVDLGFTAFEAEVYCFLLDEGAATGIADRLRGGLDELVSGAHD